LPLNDKTGRAVDRACFDLEHALIFVKELVPMSSAHIDETDIQSVLEVLHSGRLALGPRACEFEKLISEYIGVRHAIALNSGTAALHLIVKALGIGPGDEVLVPSFTFAASINALLYEGAIPVFVDIEPVTYNLDPEQLEFHISPRTRAILAVDVFGHPADWDSILDIADRHGLKIIDDSCEALGAEYKGRRIGQFGDAAAFAFYPNKQITTGEGGVVVTNSDAIAEVCRSLRNQGRGTMGSWLEHERLGYNYRLDEMSAALGCSQLKRIDELLRRREDVAGRYTMRLQGCEWLKPPTVNAHVRMSWFVYVVTLAEGLHRNRVIRELASRSIPTRAYFSPIHLQPYIRKRFGSKGATLPVTESVARRTLALPFHSHLTLEQIELVVTSLLETVHNLVP
jgi:perosamine synthetase